MNTRKTLVEKYNIPINHLDFDYIKNCSDAKELEKIVMILRSGEEGFFPDLMRCAEDKLREVKPNSRVLRCEDNLRAHILDQNDLEPVIQWSINMRDQEVRLTTVYPQAPELVRSYGYQEIRCASSITQREESQQRSTAELPNVKHSSLAQKPVASTDYKRWDRYDPDEDLLRMELDEERIKEEVERKNRINSLKCQPTPLINELVSEENLDKESPSNPNGNRMNDVETENLCLEYRIRGNEFYRAKEYENAIAEYTKAIRNFIDPQTGAYAYCNRAIALMKLKKFEKALADCEECLKIQPDNLKALLRMADIEIKLDQKIEAFYTYRKLLEYYPDNKFAENAMERLFHELDGKVPFLKATRLQITEDQPSTSKGTFCINPNDDNLHAQTLLYDSMDYAEMIRPNLKDCRSNYNVSKAMNNILHNRKTEPKKIIISSLGDNNKNTTSNAPAELILPNERATKAPVGKVLIEELNNN